MNTPTPPSYYELLMTSIMLYMDDALSFDIGGEAAFKGKRLPAPEAHYISMFDRLTYRELRLYSEDSVKFIEDTRKANAEREALAVTQAQEKTVSLGELQSHVKVPPLGDVVDALAGKTSLSNVLGVKGDYSTLTGDDLVKVKEYVRDITKATAILNMNLAMGSQGTADPITDLMDKAKDLAAHTQSLITLLDPNNDEDILHGK